MGFNSGFKGLSSAREPAHSNGCAPLQKNSWIPLL